ncbi:unnamed protein product [Rhodiola kirilowii]
MTSSTQPQQQIECWATFDFMNLDDETYTASINHIRGKYPPFRDTKFREVPSVEPLEKTEEDYFTLDFKTDQAHISGLYERRGLYLFGICTNRETGQPFEIMQGINFNLPSVHVKRIPIRVDYKDLGDPSQASYTLKDLINAVNMLAVGFHEPVLDWGPAVTTLVGVTSEAIKFITMEQHVVIGLNTIQGNNVTHTPSKRLVRILKSWSKISKSIKNAKYDFKLNYPKKRVTKFERVTKFSAGQIIALINSKDGSKEEKNIRKDKKGKRKMDDFKESERRFKKEKIQKLNKSEKGLQISSGSTEGHKYRGMAGARDLHLALNVEDKGLEEIQKAADSEDETSDIYYSKSPKLFRVRMIPHGMYTDSDSDSDSEDEETPTEPKEETPRLDSPSLVKHGTHSEAEDEKTPAPEDETSDLYYSKSPKLFRVRMIPHGMYTESDSDSDSDSEDEDEETPTEPNEETPRLDSPILVKHGTQCPAEAGVGDKDSKLEEMPSEGAEAGVGDKDSKLEEMPSEGAEAGVGDKDSKLEEMPSEGAEKKPTDDKNEGGGSLIV